MATRREVLEATIADLHWYGWWPIKGCTCDDCTRANATGPVPWPTGEETSDE